MLLALDTATPLVTVALHDGAIPAFGPVPALGEHTQEVLRGIGLTEAEIAAAG